MFHFAGPICQGIECAVIGLFVISPLIGSYILLLLGVIALVVSYVFLRIHNKNQPNAFPVIPSFMFSIGFVAVVWAIIRLSQELPMYR